MTHDEKLALFESNTGLVHKITNSSRYFYSCVTAREDLNQEGMAALWIAVNNFDSKRKIKFSTFAYHIIKNRIYNYYDRRTCHYKNLPNNHVPIYSVLKPFNDEDGKSNYHEYLAHNLKAKNNDYSSVFNILTSFFSGEDLDIMIDCYRGYKAIELHKKYGHKGQSNFYYRLKELKKTLKNYYLKEGLNGCRKAI
jgi:RNA polymerase sigma factor (sigma-70 family)